MDEIGRTNEETTNEIYHNVRLIKCQSIKVNSNALCLMHSAAERQGWCGQLENILSLQKCNYLSQLHVSCE